MLPNPFGNPAIELWNRSASDAFDKTVRIMSAPKKSKLESHKKCQASSDDVREATAIVNTNYRTAGSRINIPKEDWERLQTIIQSLADDHKMLNEENQEHRKALSMYRS